MRRALGCTAVLTILTFAAAGLSAQSVDRPAVVVLSFEVSGARVDAGVLADELAGRLIDTNRFRVMPRQWLPVPEGATRSIAAYRESAKAAGVEFLITGAVDRAISRRFPPGSQGSSPQPIAVDVRAISVASGEVVRRRTLRIEPSPMRMMRTPAPTGFSSAFLVSARQRTTSSWDADAAKRAMSTIARALDLSDVARDCSLAQEAPPARPSIAVQDFATDRTGWMPPPHLGATLAELLTDRLIAAGTFRMVDRDWLLAASGDRGPTPAAELLERAARANVDYLVAGAVTRLSIEQRSSTGGGLLPLPLIGGLLRKHTTSTVIGLTIRVVDVGTGEVVATSTAESGASDRTSSGGGVALVGHVPVVAGQGSSATGVHDRLLDAAVQDAVSTAALKIVAAAPRLKARDRR